MLAQNDCVSDVCAHTQVSAELHELFSHFDKDSNGVLDQQETLSLVNFLIMANGIVHQGLNLRMSRNDLEMPLSILSNFEWERFTPGENELVDAKASGVGLVFLKQLLRREHKTTSSQASSTSSLTISSVRQHQLPSAASWSKHLDVNKNERSVERDAMIDELLKRGEMMIKKGLFALPPLSWKSEQFVHPDEKAVLDMIGFLLDACEFFIMQLGASSIYLGCGD